MDRNALKLTAVAMVTICLGGTTIAMANTQSAAQSPKSHYDVVHTPSTATPIQHVVVIFQENVSFDHYFGTYPQATNPSGEPSFYAAPGTPSVNGLSGALLTNNPNGVNPKRLDRSQPITADMNHSYTAEQKAADGGLMDKFVSATGQGSDPSIVMDYYDGNTVTALWNYAQHFAMNDNSFGTTFGPSSPGAINLVSGQLQGATAYTHPQNDNGTVIAPDANGIADKGYIQNNTLIGDADPYYDNYSSTKYPVAAMSGKNIGDLLNAKGITWGWFEGGFANPTTQTQNVGGNSVTAYIPHHEPFQYYKSTANPAHLPPSSTAMIGKTDEANHQYDLTNFWQAVQAGNMPAVSFLKAPGAEDGHASYSDPLDEQKFLVDTINKLEQSPDWNSTAVIISYDDSDGWYDHVMGPIVNQSNDKNADALLGPGNTGTPATPASLDRAGYGPRLPLLVISPYARRNFVDNTLTDQSSILRFIEDNWNLGRIGNGSTDAYAGSLMNMFDFSHAPSNTKVFLDPATGEPVNQAVPFVSKNQTFMSVGDFSQDLDFGYIQSKAGDNLQFIYNGHIVSIPFHGQKAEIDGQRFDLGANVVVKNKQFYIPVNTLAAKLGVTVDGSGASVHLIPPAN